MHEREQKEELDIAIVGELAGKRKDVNVNENRKDWDVGKRKERMNELENGMKE